MLDTTCARLLELPGQAAARGRSAPFPRWPPDFPKVSADGKTYTFILRKGFRFSDGSPVRASAFARAIHRTLAPGVNSARRAARRRHCRRAGPCWPARGRRPWESSPAGTSSSCVSTRPAPDFIHRTATTFFCAVKPTLPSDPEGVGAVPCRRPVLHQQSTAPGERIVLKRNRFYGGKRPHHVDGFEIDLRAGLPAGGSPARREGRGRLGTHAGGHLLRPQARARRQVRARSRAALPQARVHPCGCSPSTSRGLSSGTTRTFVRRSTARSIDGRSSAGRARARGSRATGASPRGMPGFRDADVYPLEGPEIAKARALAGGNLRGGKVVFYTNEHRDAEGLRLSSLERQLAEIGLDVEVRGAPAPHRVRRIFRQAGDTRRAVGPRARALAAELRRSLTRTSTSSSRPGTRRHELHEVRPRAYKREMRQNRERLAGQ